MKKFTLFCAFLYWSTTVFLVHPNLAQAKAQPHEVPLRKVFESMGYKVVRKGKYIHLTRELDDRIRLESNSKKALKNGKAYSLTKPVRNDKQSKTYMINVVDIYKLAKEEKKEKHYRVKKGEDLSSIAKKFKVTVNNLRFWNKLSSDVIYPGQHLHTTDPIYIVKQGDSIWEIAHKTESTVRDIKFLNNLATEIVYPGQQLAIPTQPSMKTPAKFADGIFPLAQETYDPLVGTFGDGRNFSTNGQARSHEGNDIMARKWVPIFAVIEGKIVRYGWNTLGGYRITIQAKDGTTFYYAHMMAYPPGLKIGQHVSKGQMIGYVGDTGYGKEGMSGKFATHLHFGMYDASGKAMDPYLYLKWWEINP
ncbi:LysM peptidoglycan-binding domain-containing protein [Niallia sp. NCCP-28]|uniref:LysM peptidoglycan-binding domain-containing protein n=1 Tax=Niallia sp. NCCP-28 TaxID=2934712 RepID=UPI002089F470|nr:LysM peptidoglycan-binding domain-containing protein [Niallia sp. NCCP-28]GKU82114.1 hypothetical protein NCCP28_15100 [Niallia sp. NCCP-28]